MQNVEVDFRGLIMPEPKTCEARQQSDSMVCNRCGYIWDVNDEDPPRCKERFVFNDPVEVEIESLPNLFNRVAILAGELRPLIIGGVITGLLIVAFTGK